MTEFTDGTAKGKTLSLVELEKRLENLNNQLTALPLILHGKVENITVGKLNGYITSIKFNQAFKTAPTLVACLCGDNAFWSYLVISIQSITTNGANVYIWNNSDVADVTAGIAWIAIGERG